jgi:hypothetical protein
MRRVRALGVAAVAASAVAGLPAADQLPVPTAPRLHAGAQVPLSPPLAIGGGEVVLNVTVGANGRVTSVEPVRDTPPYGDRLAGAVRGWTFDAARALVRGSLQASEGRVLVIGVYRPPQVYTSPAPGEPPRTAGDVAAELPAPTVIAMPTAYPPRATRDGAVLIEIELTAAAVAVAHRVMSPPSAFDDAALDAVRQWRFDFPRTRTGAERLYVYGVVGFREPITQPGR